MSLPHSELGPAPRLHGRGADGHREVGGPDRLDDVHAHGLDRTSDGRRGLRGARRDGEHRQADDEETTHVDLQVVTPGWRPRLPRAKAALITEVWPEVSGQLLSYLRGQRVRPDVAEDIVQEVAAKLVATQEIGRASCRERV